jgi:hypothetical protein
MNQETTPMPSLYSNNPAPSNGASFKKKEVDTYTFQHSRMLIYVADLAKVERKRRWGSPMPRWNAEFRMVETSKEIFGSLVERDNVVRGYVVSRRGAPRFMRRKFTLCIMYLKLSSRFNWLQ